MSLEYTYLIVGAGMTADAAGRGIREVELPALPARGGAIRPDRYARRWEVGPVGGRGAADSYRPVRTRMRRPRPDGPGGVAGVFRWPSGSGLLGRVPAVDPVVVAPLPLVAVVEVPPTVAFVSRYFPIRAFPSEPVRTRQSPRG